MNVDTLGTNCTSEYLPVQVCLCSHSPLISGCHFVWWNDHSSVGVSQVCQGIAESATSSFARMQTKDPRSKYTDREWKTQRIFGFSPASFCISTLELFDNQRVSRKTSTKVQWNLVISVFFFIFHHWTNESLWISGSTKLWSAWIPCEVEPWRVWRARRLGAWSQSSQAWPSLKHRRNQRRSSMRKVSECRVPVEVKQRVTETHKNLQLTANFWIFPEL